MSESVRKFQAFRICRQTRNKRKKNLETLRQTAPGSIITQTMRLGRMMMDMLEELAAHRRHHFKKSHPPKQTDLFCSQETLIKILLLMASKKCAEWRTHLAGLSDNYVINQLAVQIGWLIGYFSHLDNRAPDETQYFEYGLPLINLYRQHVYQLMHAYASAKHAQEEVGRPDDDAAETLLKEIRSLSEKTHATLQPPWNDFQKQIVLIQARIEKTVIELLMLKYPIKVVLMSLFYFWFTLEAPLHTDNPTSLDGEDAFLHMCPIIELIKNTVKSLPNPKFSVEIKALNEKMQLLKSYLPHPEVLDKVASENIKQQTTHINTAIHTVTGEFIKQGMPIDAITIALFSHWMRFSVFFGVTESNWQKMDYYFPDILKIVRNYLSCIPGYEK